MLGEAGKGEGRRVGALDVINADVGGEVGRVLFTLLALTRSEDLVPSRREGCGGHRNASPTFATIHCHSFSLSMTGPPPDISNTKSSVTEVSYNALSL